MRYTNYTFSVPESKIVRVITDTDAKNEADDQFAIVQALLSPKFENVGFIGAHFGIDRVKNSMEASYAELEKVFSKMHFPTKGNLFHGAAKPLEHKGTPIDSEGARLIIQQAMADDPRPLYAIFLGPLTDLASAYLLEPRIANRLTAIWIGGGSYPNGSIEFNLGNDILAANVVFGSAINLWQVPKNMYERMTVSFAELENKVYPCGEIGKYLFDQLNEHAQEPLPAKSPFRSGETWVLGDSPAVGLILYEQRFEFDWIPAPLIGSDMQYIHTNLNRPIRVYRYIDSRLILEDLYSKLALFAQKQ
ncbi:nucleoside hydrolase [uncultured Sphaerochaeta sp.]|uniref:nucleoside hydrolase n=1 Tax=uncultured Sphaerochaeta sp. TaxID=886478 RepID=UPI002A0A3017|nr:nucleoside hydrolase [uncultured Sphaerochaeta sp.]